MDTGRVRIFDTNAIFYLGDPKRTAQPMGEALRARAQSGHLVVAYPPIVVAEVVTAIGGDPELFRQARRGVRRLLAMNARPLCDWDHRVREIVVDAPSRWQDTRIWREVMNALTAAHSPGEIDWYRGRFQRFRREGEDAFADAWMGLFFPKLKGLIEQSYARRVPDKAIVPLRKKEVEDFEAYYGSEAIDLAIVRCALERAGLELPSDAERLAQLRRRFRYFIKGNQYLISCVIRSGRSPEKHRNDCNDLELLLYLTPDDGSILVTSDRAGILGRFADEFPDRCFSYDEFLRVETGAAKRAQ